MSKQSTKFPKHYASLFQVTRGAGQNINNLAWTTVEWSGEPHDVLDEMLIINPWTFTPVYSGYYHLYTKVRINALGLADVFEVRLNNSILGAFLSNYKDCALANQDLCVHVEGTRYLIAGSTTIVEVRHNFGAVRVIGGDWTQTIFYGQKVA